HELRIDVERLRLDRPRHQTAVAIVDAPPARRELLSQMLLPLGGVDGPLAPVSLQISDPPDHARQRSKEPDHDGRGTTWRERGHGETPWSDNSSAKEGQKDEPRHVPVAAFPFTA